LPEAFEEYIKGKIDDREETYIQKKNMKVEILPNFSKMFKDSNILSSKFGKFK
jgi:hypothetical protein